MSGDTDDRPGQAAPPGVEEIDLGGTTPPPPRRRQGGEPARQPLAYYDDATDYRPFLDQDGHTYVDG